MGRTFANHFEFTKRFTVQYIYILSYLNLDYLNMCSFLVYMCSGHVIDVSKK